MNNNISIKKKIKALLLEASKQKNLTEKIFNKLKKRYSQGIKGGMPSNMELVPIYRQMVKKGEIKPKPILESIIKKRKIRTLSGVAVITVLTKNWGCPGKCIFCPTAKEKEVPKSYLANEPAVMRAILNEFDPAKQVQTRIEALEKQGHPTDKIEIIVVGGTWSAIPKEYKLWFIKRLYDALNQKTSKDLKTAIKKNEKAKHRLVGLTLETRPDWVTEEEIREMREFGCTRVELGVQSIYDDVLKASKRGHGQDAVIKATKMLKDAGFKINYHMMPNLPKSNPKKDIKMFKELFESQNFRPDMLKIYPCMVLKEAELYKEYKKGNYKPYSDKQLINIIKNAKQFIPEYVRVVRVIRDIPATSIYAGSKISNLREVVMQELKKEGKSCRCIRCREIKSEKIIKKDVKLIRRDYKASDGYEIFLSFEDVKKDKLISLLRLRIPSINQNPIFKKLKYYALIRELHTYGETLKINEKRKGVQHLGFGKRLVKEAEKIAKKEFGKKRMAIISGVGVREYYRKLGYKLEDTYMVKNL